MPPDKVKWVSLLVPADHFINTYVSIAPCMAHRVLVQIQVIAAVVINVWHHQTRGVTAPRTDNVVLENIVQRIRPQVRHVVLVQVQVIIVVLLVMHQIGIQVSVCEIHFPGSA